MRPLNRVKPALPLTVMQTYAIDAPRETHFRPATCREVDCPHHIHGWKTVVDERTELGQRQAEYIRRHSGRSFSEDREVEGLTTFVFEPGQQCFRPHETRVDRPEIFSRFGGDFRGRTTEARVLPAHGWVDDMAEDLEQLRVRAERG